MVGVTLEEGIDAGVTPEEVVVVGGGLEEVVVVGAALEEVVEEPDEETGVQSPSQVQVSSLTP